MTLARQPFSVLFLALGLAVGVSTERAHADTLGAATPPASVASAAGGPTASSGAARPWLKAAPAKKAVAPAPTEHPLRLALMVGLVAGLGVFAVLRRKRQQGVAKATRADLELVSAARVGNKAQVVVVSVGGRKLLLGVTETEISRLAWLDADVTAEEPEQSDAFEFGAEAQAPAPVTVASVLDDGPRNAPAPAPAAAARARPAPAPARSKVANAPPKRFRDALLGALGQRATSEPVDAAVTIAESTRDVVTRAGPPVATPAAVSMVDVEGQARGLVMRLQKRA